METARPAIREISDRSRLFGPDIRRFAARFEELERIQREALAALDRGEQDLAWGRLNALAVALPIVTLQLNYVILASKAEDAGVLSAHWTAMLADLDRRTTPILDAVAGFDTRRLEEALRPRIEDLAELQANLPKVERAMAKGARWSRQGLFVANGVTLATAAYQSLGAIDALNIRSPGLTFRFPGLVPAAGPATGALVTIPIDVLESLGHLVRTGALSRVVLATSATLSGGGAPTLVSTDVPLASRAPFQVTPGTRVLEGRYVDDLGRVQPWRAHYDRYGRLIARTDFNAGNASQGIPDVHHHLYEWGPGKTPLETASHLPGEFTP